MWQFIKDHGKSFWNGFVGGGVVWGGIVFADTPNSVSLGIYLLRLMGAFVLAIATAIGSALATDYYKEKIKPLLFKTKKKDNDKNKAA